MKVDSFNPENVPTINQLIQELDQYGNTQDKENKPLKNDYNKTSLKKPMMIFKDFLQKLGHKNENPMEFWNTRTFIFFFNNHF